MTIDTKHPEYSGYVKTWTKNTDCRAGEDRIKDMGTEYLPATSAMHIDGMNTGGEGYKDYQRYKQRAIFHGFYSESVENAIGRMHHKPPTIELPSKMEPLRERATSDGDTLESLLRKINEHQMVSGRLGLLGDFPDGQLTDPVIVLYPSIRLINWEGDQELSFLNIDESEPEIDENLNWEIKKKNKILKLVDGVYSAHVFNDGVQYSEEMLDELSVTGKTLNKIPFSFINKSDLRSSPSEPPLDSLADLCLALYRNEAGYQHTLHMQGQDTLVVKGRGYSEKDNDLRVGAGAKIELNSEGDAKFIGVSAAGLSEQRQSVENLKNQCRSTAGQLLESKSAESGDALEMRVAAQTSKMTQIAKAGALGLEKVLKDLAIWLGLSPDQVVVTPNLDFNVEGMSGKELLDLQSAKASGAPISEETIHNNMRKRNLTDYTYEEEKTRMTDNEL